LDAALKKAHCLLGVIDVVSADGVFAVGMLEQLRGSDDHGRKKIRFRAGGEARKGFLCAIRGKSMNRR
jgi:hypothetical protein